MNRIVLPPEGERAPRPSDLGTAPQPNACLHGAATSPV